MKLRNFSSTLRKLLYTKNIEKIICVKNERKMMKLYRSIRTVFVITFCVYVLSNAQFYPAKAQSGSAEDVVKEIYELVSFKPGETPDWDRVKSLFVEEAVVVLRASRTSHNIFSRESFIQDFKNFITRSNVDKTGFLEKIVSVKSTTVGDITHCFVVYEASIPGSQRSPQKGLDSFQLIKKDGKWRIISIVNEVILPNMSLPKEISK